MAYFWGDPYIIIVIPAFLFSLYAQFRVKRTFSKYGKIMNTKGLTGHDVARAILDDNGLYDVAVEPTMGKLTDHYDPRRKVVRLSQTVYSNPSVAALGVAAHESGHAIQHNVGYGPLVLRNRFVPIANIGSSIGPYMAIFGLVIGWENLVHAGIILFAAAVGFYLITLPVEFNASKRAIEALETTGTLSRDEIQPARTVLRAAAMTYVASAAVAVAHLLRLALLARRSDD